jgi:hypothetical protein
VKLPPGQYLTNDFPAGPTPHVALDKWEFTIDDAAEPVKINASQE